LERIARKSGSCSILWFAKENMDEKFRTLIDNLHKKYEELMSMHPVTVDTAPSDCPIGGIYLFTEKGVHLYAQAEQNVASRTG